MEGLPHYSTNVINTSAASYPSPSAISPQQLQHQQQQSSSAVSSQTLPPLQPNHQLMQQQSPYGSYPHTPRTATPNTPSSASTGMASYPPPPPQNGGRGAGYQVMGQNPYPQPYPTTTAVMTATTAASSHPQPIAPAPSPGVRQQPPVLRPMPASGVIPQPGMNSPYGQNSMIPQQSMVGEGEQPTHVVGSQGRRGVLPSAPGRPAAPPPGSMTAKQPIPQKDADGKFPCPHCTKTYLHAKHLKRHLLRHTGDRPYMCVLCRDTFSRSDILKRHFIKCSVRRGNPTGATHLSHPQAHVKKNPGGQKPMGDGDVNHVNGMANMPADGMVHPFGLIPAPDGLSNIANEQSQLSRSSSIQRIDDSNRDRRNMTGPVMGASARGGSFDQTYNGGDVSNNMGANINPQLGSYGVPQNQNGMQMFAGSGSTDWSQMFQAGASSNTVNSFPSPNIEQTPQEIALKQEPNSDATRAAGIPGGNTTDSTLFPSWGVPPASLDSYEQLSAKIINFLQPAISQASAAGITAIVFQSAYIREYLESYTHFHTHFSILHIPTFRIMEAYVGLLTSMCCIGACYTNHVSPANIREVVNFLEAALVDSSSVFSAMTRGGKFDYQSFGSHGTDMEELQAVMLTQVLLTWHGTPTQRERARNIFPLISSFVRKADFLNVSATTLYSAIHQPTFSARTYDTNSFDWQSWVEQEKRVRIMYFMFLSDVALGLYFNRRPEFDPFEVRLPLPTDDAAWEANDSDECAEALGFYGPARAKIRNPDGTQRCNQPELRHVLRALLDRTCNLQPGATNLYGKFILIHAILAMMRKAFLDGADAIHRSGTPIPQNVWFVGSQASQDSGDGGRATPVHMNTNVFDTSTVKIFTTALDKFKECWDNDMAMQFPPSIPAHPRRYGFSRDGIHFYWLANYFLLISYPTNLTTPPDERCSEMMHLLKSVKGWVLSDGASRGEELGSVGEIDPAYAASVGDLTLDMTQLFRPLSELARSPGFASAQAGPASNGGIM